MRIAVRILIAAAAVAVGGVIAGLALTPTTAAPAPLVQTLGRRWN